MKIVKTSIKNDTKLITFAKKDNIYTTYHLLIILLIIYLFKLNQIN